MGISNGCLGSQHVVIKSEGGWGSMGCRVLSSLCPLLYLGIVLGVLPVGSFGCQSTSRHGTRCCFLAQPCSNHCQETQVRRHAASAEKGTESTDNNNALTLLRLQQHVLQLTTAKAALEDIQRLVHETALYNFTSAQDRRTLNTAQCCLNSLRIRIEAQVNTVEETVKQRQLSLSLQLRKETSATSAALREH